MKLPYGKFKGKEVSEVALMDKGAGYLKWLKGQLDPNDAKYGDKNKELLNAIDDTLMVGNITETFKGTVSGGNDLTVVMDRLAELHKLVSKVLVIVEAKETEVDWDK